MATANPALAQQDIQKAGCRIGELDQLATDEVHRNRFGSPLNRGDRRQVDDPTIQLDEAIDVITTEANHDGFLKRNETRADGLWPLPIGAC